MNDVNVTPSAQRETKLLNIGRMWDNTAKATGRQPRLRIAIDRNLGLNLTFGPGSALLAFPNQKRAGDAGKNDPDYRIAVELPAATVDAEIARRKPATATAAVA